MNSLSFALCHPIPLATKKKEITSLTLHDSWARVRWNRVTEKRGRFMGEESTANLRHGAAEREGGRGQQGLPTSLGESLQCVLHLKHTTSKEPPNALPNPASKRLEALTRTGKRQTARSKQLRGDLYQLHMGNEQVNFQTSRCPYWKIAEGETRTRTHTVRTQTMHHRAPFFWS